MAGKIVLKNKVGLANPDTIIGHNKKIDNLYRGILETIS